MKKALVLVLLIITIIIIGIQPYLIHERHYNKIIETKILKY
jgi:uncharacterized membrane protein